MNLIERDVTESVIATFRAFQYGLIPELLKTSMDYLIKFGLKYDPQFYDPNSDNNVEYVDSLTYKGFNHFATNIIKIKINNFKRTQYFICTSIPELIDSVFFLLNGVYYIPLMYIYDEPIVIKQSSINLYSLFQPLTIYFTDRRAIFMRINIILDDFLKIMLEELSNDDKKILGNFYGFNLISNPSIETLNYLSSKFKCNATSKDIRNKINDLFFDDWTSSLYKDFYNIDNDFNTLVHLSLKKYMSGEKPSFIDLRHKRLTFVEPLLRPLFKSISMTAESLLRGYQPHTIGLQLDAITNHFFSKLNGEYVYNTVNGFSSVLAHKATFKNPFGKGNLPPEVSSIHWSHKSRICVTSITNKDPGATISLIPNQDIDLRFGRFSFTEEEMREK